MTHSTRAFRARIAAASLAFAVVSGGALATAAPALADETGTPTSSSTITPSVPGGDGSTSSSPTGTPTATAAPSVTFDKTAVLPSEEVTYYGVGFTPGVPVNVVIDGPGDADLAFEQMPDAEGRVIKTLTYNTVDADGAPLGRVDFPVGEYTVTLAQAGLEAPVSGAFVVSEDGATTTPPADDDTTETPAGPLAAATQDTFLPSDVVTYVLANFTPGADVSISIDGPAAGELTATIGDDGTYAGEITYNRVDGETGEQLDRIDFPVGAYTVTVVEAGSDRTATFSFEIVAPGSEGGSTPTATHGSTAGAGTPGASTGAGGSQQGGNTLATTGADDVFGIAGLGLLVAGAGVATLALRRRTARD